MTTKERVAELRVFAGANFGYARVARRMADALAAAGDDAGYFRGARQAEQFERTAFRLRGEADELEARSP